jgi:tetratricopeptide (TPR) repeat protein
MIRALACTLLLALTCMAPLAAQTSPEEAAAAAWARADHDAAYVLYRELLRTHPDHPVALHRAGLIDAWAGRHDESLALLDRLVALQPENVEAAVDRARVLGWSRRHADALAAVQRVLGTVPDHAGALELQAHIHSWMGSFDEAVVSWDRLSRVVRDFTPFRMPQAEALLAAGRTAEAMAELRLVIAASPEPLALRLRLVNMLAAARQYDEALAELDDVLGMDPDNHDALLARARFASWISRYPLSLTSYERLMELRPADATIVTSYAQVLSWSAQLDSAMLMYEAALRLDPGHIDARRGRAQVAMWAGRYAEANRLWTEVLRDYPGDVPARLGLAANLRYRGRLADAATLLDEVRAFDQEAEGLGEERRWLRIARAAAFSPLVGISSDSDGNRIGTARLNATFQFLAPVETRVGVSVRRFEQQGRTDLTREVTAARLGFGMPVAAAWRMSVGIGVWQEGGSGERQGMTLSAAAFGPLAGLQAGASFVREVFDVTALVVGRGVVINEFTGDLGAQLRPALMLSGSVAAATLQGTAENQRLLATARLGQRWGPVTVGPAIRAIGYRHDRDDGYWDPQRYLLFEIPVTLAPVRGDVRPRLEVSTGYQSFRHGAIAQPWSAAFRAEAGLSANFGPRRTLSVQAVLANSGLQQLSPGGDANYRYRDLTLFGSWIF